MSATHEPTRAEASELIRTTTDWMPGYRVDGVHAAQMAVYRRGQAFERRESAALAHEAAERFAAEVRFLISVHAAGFAGNEAAEAFAAEVGFLAEAHAVDFAGVMAARHEKDAAHDALPWYEQTSVLS